MNKVFECDIKNSYPDVRVTELRFLPPAYVVYGKVMFLIMSVCLSTVGSPYDHYP